jgi:hypothetical protein
MSLDDALVYGGTALVVVVMFYVPRLIGARRRLQLGVALFAAAWLGILSALWLSDMPLLQSEGVAFLWVGASALALIVAIPLVLTALLDWWGPRRPRRQRWQFPPLP